MKTMKILFVIAILLCTIQSNAKLQRDKRRNKQIKEVAAPLSNRLENSLNQVQNGSYKNQNITTTNKTIPKSMPARQSTNTTNAMTSLQQTYQGVGVSKREEIEVRVATDDQIQTMCRSRSLYCNYSSPPELNLHFLVTELPKMLQYLKDNRLKIEGIRLVITGEDPLLQRITLTGDEGSMDYKLEFSGNQHVQLNNVYHKYITGGIDDLWINLVSDLRSVDDGFFEKFFPNIRSLRIAGSLLEHLPHALPKLHIGFLPKLQELDISYVFAGDITGCTLPLGETSCFANNTDIRLTLRNNQNPVEVGLIDFNLPENVHNLSIRLHQIILKATDILEDKTADTVNLVTDTTKAIAGLNFTTTVIKTKLFIEGGQPADSGNLIKNLDTMLHNPLITNLWEWRYSHGSSIRIPVVFKSVAVEQPFETLNGDELGKTPCKFAKDVADYGNDVSSLTTRKKPDDQEGTIRVLTVRGLYVDMTELIDSKDSSTFDEMEVTAFHVHVSANRDVTFPLRVSYMKITSDDDAAIYNRVARVGNRNIKSKGSTGAQLKLLSDVDAIFMQVVKICTAILIAQERNLGSIDTSENSIGNQMWSYPVPSTLKGSNSEIAKAEQMIVKVGDFMEYLHETASEKAMRVPYLSLEYQEENLVILLNMAESIVAEKRHEELMYKVEDIKLEILDSQDRATLALLHTEYKRTVSLVLISTRRAHDIEKKLNATIELVNEVNKTFSKYKTEMEAANKTFQAGVQGAKKIAYAEVAAAVTSSVISFFSGGFDPGKIARAAKKMKDLAYRIKKLMNLRKIFAKLANLIKTLRNIQELSRRASKSMGGRMGRLFEKLKNFRIKRKTYLEKLIRDSDSLAFKGPQLLKKKIENQKFIDKYTKVFEKVAAGRESVDYLNTVMQGIVEAEKAKVTLANAFTEGSVQDLHEGSPAEQTATKEDIEEALNNEFMVAAGDQHDQLEDLKMTLKEYELGESKNVIQEGEKLNAADVLEWDAANANVEGTMDASISMDIPETTTFKAALMKMNLAGKAKTQAMIDEAAIRVDLDRARFETTTYFKEGSEILRKIKKTEEDLKKRRDGQENIESSDFKERYQKQRKEQYIRLGWKEFHVKFNVLIASLSYCSAYYYYHLSLCPPEHSFDFDTSLEDMVHQQRELKRQSLLQLEDFYPPPQTMKERTLTFKERNNTCKCMIRENQSPEAAENPQKIYAKLVTCVNGEIQNKNVSNNETKRLLEVLERGCEVNKVADMKEFHRITLDIGINSTLAEDHSRVRIDEMQVILFGAKTNDGVITLSIESSGVAQDRYKGEAYSFYGDKWRRDFSYYSPQSKVGSNHSQDEDQEALILDAADVYRSFRGIYRTSTLFTNWVIKIDPKRNPGLDLSQLKKIEVKFSGSFVASGDYNFPEKKEPSGEEEESEVE